MAGGTFIRKNGQDSFISAPEAKILVVDDSEINLNVTGGLLKTFDIKCDTALSGIEAIEKITYNEYDLVFMDHMMPDMDGVETTRILREKGHTSDKLPIIALTANAIDDVTDILTNSQLNDYISKPIDRMIFIDVLKKWLPKEKIKDKSFNSKQNETTIYSEQILKISKIDEIDIELALKRVNNKSEILESSLQIMKRRLPETIDKTNDYLACGDIKNFTIEVHGIKGSLMNIGATELAKLAEALEIHSRNQNIAFCKENLPELNAQLLIFYKKLHKIIDNQDNNQHKEKGEIEALRAQVKEIRQCIDDFEIDDAIEILEKAVSYTYSENIDSFLQKLLHHAQDFEYEKAIELIDKEEI